MIYLLAFLIGFFFIIYIWNNVFDTCGKVLLTILIIALCLLVSVLINSILVFTISPTVLGETEIPVYTNSVTNQYYLINSKGELIDTDNYEVSPKINEPTGIEKKIEYDMGIWGISKTDTEYRILIPPVTVSNPLS